MVSEKRKTGSVGRKGKEFEEARMTSHSIRWLSTCRSGSLYISSHAVLRHCHVSFMLQLGIAKLTRIFRQGSQVMST